ncbi:MAG TPA: 4-alpha-glucanotransferase [Candidatus Coprenecus pullistercoris]|nr:4-alpha-glucanotransferase [Candidatus Coprenecus pullistercoris]
MVIHFSIHFHTEWGQNLHITGSLPELGGGDPAKAVPMSYDRDGLWKKEIRLTSLEERLMSYKYLVKSDDGGAFYEVGPERTVGLNNASKDLFFNDEWQGNSEPATFLTAPFSEIFYSHEHKESTQMHIYSKELIIRVTAPAVERDSVVAVCGDSPILGAWDPAKAPEMTPIHGSRWVIHLPADKLGSRITYKFIKRSTADGTVTWEDTSDRVRELPPLKTHQTLSVEHSAAAFRIGRPRFTGTAVPVFALRTSGSCGIGDFTDIKTLGDWAAATGQSIIQILPVNDTTSTGTWTDSYPYGGISVMALHPIYANITEIGPLKNPGHKSAYTRERRSVESLATVDYEKVLALKIKYLRIQFADYGKDTFAEPKFLAFYHRNKEWLLPYCAFCTLRDHYGTADFSKWGEYSRYTPELAARLFSKGNASYQEMTFHIFVQYHLHRQLLDAAQYLHAKGIALKGDIPIGITRNSADAWASPELFNMNSQAGAPPDAFSAEGQNWGFPTYNWDKMAETQYSWWRKRFTKMSEYFDAYRIDHILGFFRIWEIPSRQVKGVMGHFSPALPMSYEELRDRGFDFDYARHATPYIRYRQLREMFGDKTDTVMREYLDSSQYEVFTLKPEFSTQRKIEDHFGPEHDDIKDGLMALVSEVLFMEDERQPGKFHPRISAQFTYSYRDLPEGQKEVFNRIYDHFFYKRHNDLWRKSALHKLPELISATDMLTCAEDLGMIPECVPEVLRDLRILSLEIFRMSKDPSRTFADPSAYPYMSVCTTGTHDTSTLREWWEEDRGLSARFWHEVLHENGEPPYYCEPWLCEKILRLHTSSPSMLTILPLQDWLSIDGSIRAQNPASERINVPSDPKHYWRYRMHVAIEDLLADKELTYNIRHINGNR